MKGLFFITNHENAPIISHDLSRCYGAIVSREQTDLQFEDGVSVPFYSTEYIKSPFAARQGVSTYQDIEAALELALGNPHTFYILERLRYFNGGRKTDPFRSCFNYLPHLQEALLRACDLLSDAGPDYLVFSSTPHDLEAWLFFLLAASREKRIFVICQSELPWRAFLKEIEPDSRLGYREIGRLPEPRSDGVAAELSAQAHAYIARKRRDYTEAEPQYMKMQKKPARKDRSDRLRKLVRRIWQGRDPKNRESTSNLDREISKTITRLCQRRLRSSLNSYASDRPPEGKFVTVFLHFQPERTSIPEGGVFAPQVNAIAAIHDALPAGWSVVVKEHPSMFLLKSKRPFRHPDFYRIITAMPRVCLVDERQPSFDLIDRSEAVVTLTGTVGFEALCRGIPVITMGDAAYRHYPGVVDIYGKRIAGLDLEKAIDGCRRQLSDQSLITTVAAVTERATYAGGQSGELLSRDTMAAVVFALGQAMQGSNSDGAF